jgi:hypothetical protein
VSCEVEARTLKRVHEGKNDEERTSDNAASQKCRQLGMIHDDPVIRFDLVGIGKELLQHRREHLPRDGMVLAFESVTMRVGKCPL